MASKKSVCQSIDTKSGSIFLARCPNALRPLYSHGTVHGAVMVWIFPEISLHQRFVHSPGPHSPSSSTPTGFVLQCCPLIKRIQSKLRLVYVDAEATSSWIWHLADYSVHEFHTSSPRSWAVGSHLFSLGSCN